MHHLFELNDQSFIEEACGYCGNRLKLKGFFFYGWRSLFDCSCVKCKASFLIDMPVFSGISYPAIYDKNKRKVINDIPSWWGLPFNNKALKILDRNIISDTKIKQTNDKVIIFNLLDFVFGHSFMRLEKLTHYIDNPVYAKYDFLVLIPSQLRYLIKEFENKLSVIETGVSFHEYKFFYRIIDNEVKTVINNYSKIYMEMLSHPQQESLDLDKLSLPINKWPEELKKVVIVYRKDRIVGVTRKKQHVFYRKLIKLVRDLDVEIFVIGDKDSYGFDGINDLRVPNFTADTDDLWNEACSEAIVIGVHGSNMLIPSLCSAYSIELVSYDKLYNFGQASAFLNTLNQLETIQKYRYIYGNDCLSDISPNLVFELAKSLITVMNNTFNSVRMEKSHSLKEVRQSYRRTHNAKNKMQYIKKAAETYYKLRRKVGL